MVNNCCFSHVCLLAPGLPFLLIPGTSWVFLHAVFYRVNAWQRGHPWMLRRCSVWLVSEPLCTSGKVLTQSAPIKPLRTTELYIFFHPLHCLSSSSGVSTTGACLAPVPWFLSLGFYCCISFILDQAWTLVGEVDSTHHLCWIPGVAVVHCSDACPALESPLCFCLQGLRHLWDFWT